jgi:hypothetical protein
MVVSVRVDRVRSTVQTERLGVAAVFKVAQQAGWFFREQPNPDEGIDAQIEAPTAQGRPSGHLLGLQIKSGTSHAAPFSGGWRYSIKVRHLEYWRRYSLPVVIVLYDPDSDTSYWQPVRSDTLRLTASGGHVIDIPEDQQFSVVIPARFAELAREALSGEGTKDLSQALRGRRADFDIGWMELLQSGDRLFLEAEQETQGSLGRGSLRVVIESSEGGTRTGQAWPWAFLPGDDYAAELQKIFPWADLSLDLKTYRRATFPEFVAKCATWDEALQAYDSLEGFDDWFNENYNGSLKPYGRREHTGVALWRLELRLNDFGRSVMQKEHAAIYKDAMFDVDLEEEQERLRAKGWYEMGVFDHGARALSLEGVYFTTEEWSEPLLLEPNLFTKEGNERAIAAAILEHALGTAPLEALVSAFLNRHGRVMTGDESLPLGSLTNWLWEVEAPKPF